VSSDKVETVHSVGSGRAGRAVTRVREASLTLDSSARPQNDAFTNSEAFLAGISSCGVTLIELYAEEQGLDSGTLRVTATGARTAERPADFDRIDIQFGFAGISLAQAEDLVGIWRER